MTTSKHDLSFDSTKLDFEALTRTASVAYGATRRHIENELNELQHLLTHNEYARAMFPLTARQLAEDAERLAIAAETYHTLLNARHRNEIEIVNKPEIPRRTPTIVPVFLQPLPLIFLLKGVKYFHQ